VFVAFGLICYSTYGTNMNEPLITEMLPPADPLVIATKMLFIVNLICSYSLNIYPTNTIIEGWIFKKDDKSDRTYMLKNLSRAIVAVSACMLGVALAAKIDKFLGLMGALLCAPLALIFPASVHLSLLARTAKEKIVDIAIIGVGLFILVFSASQSIMAW